MTVLKNGKHEAFAKLVAAGKGAGASYRAAYEKSDPSPGPSDTMASRLLKDGSIVERVKELRAEAAKSVDWTIADALQEFRDVANAPVDELIGARIGACRYCHGEGHLFHWKEREYLEAVQGAEARGEPLPDPGGGFGYMRTALPHPACPECEGEGVMRVVPCDTSKLSPQAKLIYEGIKMTAAGPEIKIADRAKARENAARINGSFVERKEISGPGGAALTVVISQDDAAL